MAPTSSTDPSRVTLEELTVDPHPVFAALRRNGSVVWIEALTGWVVLDRDIAIDVMRDAATFTVDHPGFTTAQVVGPSMLSLDGSEHRRHRDPFADGFRAGEIRQRFADYLRRRAEELTADLKPQGSSELRGALAAPFAVDVVAELLGMLNVDPVELLRLYGDIVGAVTSLSIGDEMPAAGPAAVVELRAHVRRARELGDNMLAVAALRLTDDEVVSNAAVMLFGGIETSEGMTASALWYLLREPGVLDSIATDRDLVPRLIEESLRLEPAASRIDRYATRPVELGGARIAENDLVIISLAAANRDPGAFPEPDDFRLDRPGAGGHITFAQGPHVCIGQHLARMETAAIINAVLDGLPGLELDDINAIGPRGLVFRKPVAVAATWQADV